MEKRSTIVMDLLLLTMQYIKVGRAITIRLIWWAMVLAAILSLITVGSFPFVKAMMYNYPEPDVGCLGDGCSGYPTCIINGTALGSDFGNVDAYYTFPISTCALLINFLLATRIVGCRYVNLFFSTFAFFCGFVFPIRFIFLAMQTLEFTKIGGDYYTLLLVNPDHYDCPLFSGSLDSVFLMHLRFILLVVDFVTFHFMIVTVPLYYNDDKFKLTKYSAVNDEQVDDLSILVVKH
ncbi:unnamed protein product [Caenorhabditis nigoni]